jgi:hypothetical protein
MARREGQTSRIGWEYDQLGKHSTSSHVTKAYDYHEILDLICHLSNDVS